MSDQNYVVWLSDRVMEEQQVDRWVGKTITGNMLPITFRSMTNMVSEARTPVMPFDSEEEAHSYIPYKPDERNYTVLTVEEAFDIERMMNL